MALLLSQKAMCYQICSVCKKYLSCGPTKIYFNGDVKCGRCSKETDAGAPSLYDKIAENLKFVCINHFEGCSVLLKYNETWEHEKACIGRMYECPLCDKDKYIPNSLLYLLNHYKVKHEKSVLMKPEFYLQYNSVLEDSFVYYDNSESLFVNILVQFNGTNLGINASTVGNRLEQVKYRIRISVDGLDKLKTKFKQCTGFGFNVDMFHLEINDLFKDGKLSSVLCVIDFDISQISKNKILLSECNSKSVKSVSDKTEGVILLENYGTDLGPSYEDANFKKKIPKIYITKDLGLKVRSYEDIFFLEYGSEEIKFYDPQVHIAMFCNFCENYFVPSITQWYCGLHVYIVCPTCFQQGVKKCLYCKTDLKYTTQPIASQIYYYCGFGCSTFFNGEELKVHEKYCNLNKEKSLTSLELGRLYFDKYYIENYSAENKTFLVRSNAVLLGQGLGCKGTLYFVTDYFKGIVFYHAHGSFYHFQVAHRYTPNKYYILIKIVVDEDVKTSPNIFSIKCSFKRCYFAVLLRKTEEQNINTK